MKKIIKIVLSVLGVVFIQEISAQTLSGNVDGLKTPPSSNQTEKKLTPPNSTDKTAPQNGAKSMWTPNMEFSNTEKDKKQATPDNKNNEDKNKKIIPNGTQPDNTPKN